MAKRASPLCCWLLVVVAMALYMVAGARAQLTCSTNPKSALVEDAVRAFFHLRERGDYNLCQKNCDKDRGCTVLDEFETAQLKICGQCDVCIPIPLANRFFDPILFGCGRATDDGKNRVSGKFAPGETFEFVVAGKDESVEAGIEMKLSE